MDHIRLGLLDGLGQIQQRLAERFVGADQFQRVVDQVCGLCVGQEIPDKRLRAMGALDEDACPGSLGLRKDHKQIGRAHV